VAEPKQQIRAQHTDSTVTVYQAYAPEIGLPAARDGRFPAVWKRDRMTWIKPSFLWMMYRCGWGTKEEQSGHTLDRELQPKLQPSTSKGPTANGGALRRRAR